MQRVLHMARGFATLEAARQFRRERGHGLVIAPNDKRYKAEHWCACEQLGIPHDWHIVSWNETAAE